MREREEWVRGVETGWQESEWELVKSYDFFTHTYIHTNIFTYRHSLSRTHTYTHIYTHTSTSPPLELLSLSPSHTRTRTQKGWMHWTTWHRSTICFWATDRPTVLSHSAWLFSIYFARYCSIAISFIKFQPCAPTPACIKCTQGATAIKVPLLSSLKTAFYLSIRPSYFCFSCSFVRFCSLSVRLWLCPTQTGSRQKNVLAETSKRRRRQRQNTLDWAPKYYILNGNIWSQIIICWTYSKEKLTGCKLAERERGRGSYFNERGLT